MGTKVASNYFDPARHSTYTCSVLLEGMTSQGPRFSSIEAPKDGGVVMDLFELESLYEGLERTPAGGQE